MNSDNNFKLLLGLFTVASFISGAALAWGLNNQELDATRQDNKTMRIEIASMHSEVNSVRKLNAEYQKLYNERLSNISADIAAIKQQLDSIGWAGKAKYRPMSYEF
jgi:uncharacterized protein YlxW (UPF0749 family)